MKILYQLIIAFLFLASGVKAQKQNTGLKIGDSVPDVLIRHILNFPKSTARLSDFKGKLIIIDFFNTACSPCIGALPFLDTLQSRFKDDLIIIPVTSEKKEKVQKTLSIKPSLQNVHLPIVYLDTALKNLFPHYSVPHEIIIDGNGIVKAITTAENINDNTIDSLLQKKSVSLYVRDSKTPMNHKSPLFMEQRGQKPIYYCLITEHYDQELNQTENIEGRSEDGASRIFKINGLLLSFYRLALYKHNSSANSFPDNRIILNVRDSSRFLPPKQKNMVTYREWYLKNSYCLDLVVPPLLNPKIYDCLKDELDKTFGIESKIEPRKIKCYSLKRVKEKDGFSSSAKDTLFDSGRSLWTLRNIPISNLMENINVKSRYPVLNETGYYGNVDIKLTPDFNNIKKLTTELNQYGLTLEETYRDLAVIVISDRHL